MVAQVDGSHYGKLNSYQHWDWVSDLMIPYLPATASKYICRWRKKNGVVDLKKARSYLEKLMTTPHQLGLMKRLGDTDGSLYFKYTEKLMGSQEIPLADGILCLRIAEIQTESDIVSCIETLDQFIVTAEFLDTETATMRAYINQGNDENG